MKKLSDIVKNDSVKIYCLITGKSEERKVIRTTKTQIVTIKKYSNGNESEHKHNKNNSYHVGYDDHTMIISNTEYPTLKTIETTNELILNTGKPLSFNRMFKLNNGNELVLIDSVHHRRLITIDENNTMIDILEFEPNHNPIDMIMYIYDLSLNDVEIDRFILGLN